MENCGRTTVFEKRSNMETCATNSSTPSPSPCAVDEKTEPEVSPKNKYRWKVLILGLVNNVGHYFCYVDVFSIQRIIVMERLVGFFSAVQLPSALVSYFYEEEFAFTKSQTATIFSIAFVPSCVMAIVGGLLGLLHFLDSQDINQIRCSVCSRQIRYRQDSCYFLHDQHRRSIIAHHFNISSKLSAHDSV